MRDYVIHQIRESIKWNKCIDNGMEQDLPNLETLSDSSLLEMYHFYIWV